ncbi:MAG: terminase gpA endonuclease subunit [Pseudomonadota bacterium]
MSETLAALRAETFAALRPPARLDLPEWIESKVRLPGEVSAQTGPMVLTQVQRGIAEAMGDPEIERLTLVKPVRLGFSTLLSAVVAYHCSEDAQPILAVLPTESDCRGWIVDDVEPIFGASPDLRGLLTEESDPSGRSTLLSRKFPGGSLKVVSAKSPRNLRRHNAAVLLIDEADAMESGPEGSPLTLAERRTLSFPQRRIFVGSTPTWEDTSHVLRLYAQSDQRVFQLCCGDCGAYTAPIWRHIEWPEGKPEDAAFVCPECGTVHPETRKAEMVENGRWFITKPEVKGHAGFRTNVLVSTLPAASLGKIAQEFLAAKDHPDLLQSWTNTLMAEGWRSDAGEVLDETALAGRREAFSLENLPEDALVLTCGVDVQHDRLDAVTLAHGRSETFVVDQRVFWGPVNESDDPWRELDQFLGGVWTHPAGGILRMDACAIDSGDGNTMDRVLAFASGRLARRVVPIKGVEGNRPAIQASKTKGQRLFIVGVDGLKANLTARLARGTSIRFSDTLDDRFFEELASERRVVKYRRGVPVAQWERIPGRQAESLDSVIYALAVRNLVGVNLEVREAELASRRPAAKRPTVARSKFLTG